MQINLPPDVAQRLIDRVSIAPGATEVDVIRQGLDSLDQLDAERDAIQIGIDALREGRVQNFEDFDREFRQRNDIASSS